uniref:Uncharacterized protein n=1 Tax=Panagrolaimus sp. PS1159 TaxID=55785 RepID=A0AC35F1P0_9BILA
MNQIAWVPWLWAFLFFAMLFLLGISSQFGLAEVLCTCIYDTFPSTKNRHLSVASCVCFVLFLGGVVMTTKAGIFYFSIFNDYCASFALLILIILELILVCYIYGIRNYIKDLRSMFGPPKNIFGKIFGKTGWYFIIVWCAVAPICISVLIVHMVIDQLKVELKYGSYQFPDWSMYLAWFLSVVPLFAIPIALFANVIHFRAIKKPLKDLACVREDWGEITANESKSSISPASDNDVELEKSHASPPPSSTTASSNLYKIRPIEISSTTSDAWNPSTVTARPGKSH